MSGTPRDRAIARLLKHRAKEFNGYLAEELAVDRAAATAPAPIRATVALPPPRVGPVPEPVPVSVPAPAPRQSTPPRSRPSIEPDAIASRARELSKAKAKPPGAPPVAEVGPHPRTKDDERTWGICRACSKPITVHGDCRCTTTEGDTSA